MAAKFFEIVVRQAYYHHQDDANMIKIVGKIFLEHRVSSMSIGFAQRSRFSAQAVGDML